MGFREKRNADGDCLPGHMGRATGGEGTGDHRGQRGHNDKDHIGRLFKGDVRITTYILTL